MLDRCWVLKATLLNAWVGGTILIIINSTDGKLIKLTHGK
ncbi:NTF2 fold immunity protein [Pontibacter sp. BAB1700]